ncbi:MULTISPECIES: tripartite tricarboxylate transporter substrate binding protein [unclassified Paenibacillus]|uniref:Bug family tripartite tricarboxylate transporter substrate binding protein n=1 Tax=unclassified Paenibacillus TaxID=185978 RepID=UPI001AE11CAA|nr:MULTISPECIES: tripartite tricarboxylate transporter substrate binding protein [unclassified Paenibacillus]MBP1154053.1 tripartite-type tricarboxylate transporter receptor subunit TctC [Paenibacillus sp. PvP091]MBP1170562.1 tripartite-type tricarboxylate transporter receptor subunit TctC [Paenibacillus sp. PvR098]MBP2441590.1 tripartite-type tricarboxylate transporter receptor subunit TctC [Paenibacillus sp. PvP052]
MKNALVYRRSYFHIILVLLICISLIGCSSAKSTGGDAKTGGMETTPAATAALGSEPAVNFPKERIRFIVGANPGGGFDTWARALAPYLEKYLPGDYPVVIENIPGAGQVIATEALAKAKPDGHTIQILTLSGMAVSQLMGNVKYDLNKFTWLGQVSKDVTVAVVGGKSKYQSLEDIKKVNKEMIVSTNGMTASTTIANAILMDVLKVKWKSLNHNDTASTALSIIRGDGEFSTPSYDTVRANIQNGDLRPLAYLDNEPHPELPGVPSAKDLGYSEYVNAFTFARMVAAPPGTDPAVAKILSDALKKAIEDPQFQESIKKLELSTHYLSPQESTEAVKKAFETFGKYKSVIEVLFKG